MTQGALTSTSTLELTFTSDPAIPVITSPRDGSYGWSTLYLHDHDGQPESLWNYFSLTGNLPLGLGLDPATGIISGTFNPADQNGGALLGNVQTLHH